MNITNPSLVLVFPEAPVSGNPIEQNITGTHIVSKSIRINRQLLNGLKSSSNQLTLQLTRDCPQTTDIIASDGDVRSILKDGTSTIFTGYLSTNWTWTLTEHGEQALNITIEDVGTRLLTTPFVNSGYHLFNYTAEVALAAVCQRCGITIATGRTAISGNVLKVVDSSVSCRDILDQMLYELGYVYYFNNLGQLDTFRIDCTTLDGISTLDGDDLVVSGGKAVSLQKSLRQYSASKVTYTELGTAEDYLVYRNTSGQDASHPYCNLELQPNEYFDGTEVYTLESPDEFRENALIEACNAESEADIVGSNKIVAVSNVQETVTKEYGLTCSITAAGGPYLSINAHNPTQNDLSFSRMDARADIIYEKNTSIVRTGDSGSCAEEALEYVHDRTTASRFANLLCQYNRYCSSKYTFQSAVNLACGNIVRLHDDVFSGLDVTVMVYAREERDGCNTIRYSAIGISVFSLDRQTYHRASATGSTDPRANSPRLYSGVVLTGGPVVRGFPGRVEDKYINVTSGDVYVCTFSGDASTALWELSGNIRGPEGDTSVLTVDVQYSLSSSSDTFNWPFVEIGDDTDSLGFSDDAFGIRDALWDSDSYRRLWYRGLFVWKRVHIIAADGSETFGDPEYCKEITQSFYDATTFSIVSDSPTWNKNLASRDNITVSFRVVASGFEDSNAGLQWQKESVSLVILPYRNGASLPSEAMILRSPLDTLSPSVSFSADCNWDSLEISGTLRLMRDSVLLQEQKALTTMSAVDVTVYDVYGGVFVSDSDHGLSAEQVSTQWFTDNYGGLLEGYSFVDGDEKVIKFCIRSANDNVWTVLGADSPKAGEILSRVERDYWSLYSTMSQAGKDALWDLYGYKQQIIAESIATARLVMYGDGVITGGGVPADLMEGTDVDDEGFLLRSGYHLCGRDGKIRAKGLIASDGRFRDITIFGKSTFNGEINSEVLETVLENSPDSPISVSSPSSSATADGVRGNEVKANLTQWLEGILGDSHQTQANSVNISFLTVSGVSLNGNTGADKVLRFSSVRTAMMALFTQNGSNYDSAEQITWTNPYPTDIKIYPDITAKREDYRVPVTYVSWSETDRGSSSGTRRPTTHSRPDDPDDGDFWDDVSNVQYDSETHRWTYDYVEYTATVTTEDDYGSDSGSIQVFVDNVRQYSYSSLTVSSGSVVKVVLGGASAPYESYHTGSGNGSVSIKWKESENYAEGILFVKNASRSSSFYLSSLSDSVWTTAESLTLVNAGVTFLLDVGHSGSWQYESNYGEIHKLFRFSWNGLIQSNRTFSRFESSSCSIEVVEKGGAEKTHSGIFTQVRATDTSAEVTHPYRYGSQRTITLSYSDFYRSWSLSFTPLAKIKGVRSSNLDPLDSNGEIGSAENEWKSVRAKNIYANGTALSSARKLKEDISLYEDDALKLIKDTQIVRYRYKSDHDDPNAYRHIGFIADDTDEALSTPQHDSMDVGSCIGVLFKAVQQLEAQIKEVRDG